MAHSLPSAPSPSFLSASPGGGVDPADSAELLRATLACAGAAAWSWNPVSREFRWSSELPALYGLPADTVMTPDLPWRQVYAEDAAPLRQALKDQMAAGDRLDLEYRVLAGDDVRWLNTRGRRQAPERVLGITLDITERRRAEQLDAESRRTLELVATGAPLEACLDAITGALGRLHPGVRAAVLRPGRHGEAATWTLAARFPLSVVAALRDAPGGAVPRIEGAAPVAYHDIAASGDWPETWHQLSAVHRIHACVAHPVRVDGGEVAATLCLFLAEARAPGAWERRLAAFGAHVVGIALARHQAEAGLRHERERLRAIFAQSVAGIALYDLQGHVVEANERFCDILGRSRDALLGSHVLELTHPDDRAETETLFADVAEGRRPSFSIEKRYVRGDGTIAWVRKDANLVRDAQGRPLHVAAIAADISERHRADQRLRLVIDAVPALIAYIDTDTRYQLNNKAYEEWFGFRREEVHGRTMREVLGDASFERLQPYVRKALAGERISYEGLTPYRYGGTRYIRADYVPDVTPDGAVAGMYAFVTDISAQKQAESLARDSEQRMREFADSAPAMLWVTDTDNKLVFISRRWTEHTGQSPEDAYRGGFGWTQMAHPEDRTAVGRRFIEASARREAFEFEYRLHCADGRYRWAIDAGCPRFDKDGRWLGYVGAVLDAHEQTEAREALREADRRKDEFLATLAHELRNPLAPIRNALHLLALAGEKTQPQSLLEMLDRQVNHLVRLVDDLMEASRISRGKLALRLEPLDLHDVLRTALETSKPLIERGRHQLEVALPDVTLPMVGDAVRLAQIFANLLNNAAKFTDDCGRILLTVERKEGLAVVRIRDSGIGIAADQLPRLFEMFGQLDRQAGRAHGGLGIGLALAQRLAEMHGGEIRAASEGEGRGSTFTVTLPLTVDAARTGENPAPLGRLNDRRILVVDDNIDAADSLAMLLRILGAEVRVAHSGVDAHAIAVGWRPAVVLLDLGMPGMDGFQVARRLRAERSLAGLRLIALTGWGQEEDRQRTRAEGFDHHLIKPVDINLLHALLTAVQSDQRHML